MIATVQEEFFQKYFKTSSLQLFPGKDEIAQYYHDSKLVSFLCEKFSRETSPVIRLKILKIFLAAKEHLQEDDFELIFGLISIPGPRFRELIREIFATRDEKRLLFYAGLLAQTGDYESYNILEPLFSNTGIIDSLQKEIRKCSKEKFSEVVQKASKFQNPSLFREIFKRLSNSDLTNSDLLQNTFETLGSVATINYTEFLFSHAPEINKDFWQGIFYGIKKGNRISFENLLFDFYEKQEEVRIALSEVTVESDSEKLFNCFFVFFNDAHESVRFYGKKGIEKWVKKLSNEKFFNHSDFEKANEIAQVFQDFLSKNHTHVLFSFLSEQFFTVAIFNEKVFLDKLKAVVEYSGGFFLNYLKKLSDEERKNFILKACSSSKIETNHAILGILSNRTFDYIVRVFDEILLNNLNKVPITIFNDLIGLAFRNRPKDIIITVLNNPEREIRERVIDALSALSLKEAISPILTLANDPDVVIRKKVLEVILAKNLNHNEKLRDFLFDPDVEIVVKVLKHISTYGDFNDLAKLNRLLNSSREPRIIDETTQALSMITKRNLISSFEELGQNARYSVVSSLLKLDPEFILQTQRDFSSPDQKTRRLANRIISLLWDEIPLARRMPISEGVTHSDPFVRSTFAKLLAHVSEEKNRELIKKLLEDNESRVRANAIEAIGLLAKSSKELDETNKLQYIDLLRRFLNDENCRIRANAIVALFFLGFAGCETLIYQMLHLPGKRMQLSAVFALGELKESKYFSWVSGFLKSSEPDLRRNAIKSLAKFDIKLKPEEQIKKCLFDSDESVRKIAQESIDALETRLNHEDPEDSESSEVYEDSFSKDSSKDSSQLN
ncbi:MAG: HEAT repeat domain-containing protein [Candidatus Riflebacteria bacterium]|nr:HEAT repeat domain-containing protein [Candidatus Riflebacteria bacterium]